MCEKNIAEMKWSEIPAETPLYEVLQAIGFPEPMIILKHLNKQKGKKGKKPDMSAFISILWMSKEDIDGMIKKMYYTVSRSSEVRQYLVSHPEQAALLANTIEQLKEEPVAVVAERNLNEWRKLFIEEEGWENLMKETPLTIATKVMEMITETDYLNMTVGEYFANFNAEDKFEKVSVKALANKFVEAEEKERRIKEFRAAFRSAAGGNLEDLLKMFGKA